MTPDPDSDLRRQAEARLADAPLGPLPEDALRLVHELQVHQLELALQNEELHRTRAEAEAALERYTDLYDFAPVGYVTLGRDGAMLQLNLAGAALLGEPRGQLVGRRFRQWVAPESRAAADGLLAQLFAGEPKVTGEVVLQSPGREACWVRLDGAPTDDGQTCRLALVDITDRRRGEEALRVSDERLRLALRSAPVTVSHQDGALRYTWVYAAGPSGGHDDWLHRTDDEVLGPEAAAPLVALKQRVLATGQAERAVLALGNDPGAAWWDVTAEPLRDAAGDVVGVTCAAMDVTESRRSDAQLRERLEQQVRHQTHQLRESNAALVAQAADLRRLTRQLSVAEERLRRELGATLHEHVQQLLVGALLHTEIVLRQSTSTAGRESAERVRQLVTEALGSIRTLAWTLSPPILYELGLGAALPGLAERSRVQYGLRVHLEVDPRADPADENVRVLLFRSIQELLLNVAKHAQVDTARVRLERLESGAVHVEVIDQGVGFDPAAAAQPAGAGGLGLASLRERLAHLGGQLTVESAPGQGTTVSLVMPPADGA